MATENSELQTYEVNIAGLPLRLRSSHDPVKVRQLTGLVDEKVKQVMQAGGQQLSYQKSLLLTCLHLAEELMNLKDSALTQISDLEIKTQNLLTDMESSPVPQSGIDN